MAGGPIANTGSTGFTNLMNPNRKWYNNRRLFLLSLWTVLLLITSSTNGFDGSMVNGLQQLPQWVNYFHNPSNSQLGLFSAIQNIGNLAAFPFTPYFCDHLGRRTTVFIGAFIMCVATAIQTASQSVHMFIGARFMIGFGLTFAANAAPMLVTEIAYPRYRAPLTSAYNSLWYLGAIIAAWATFGTFKIGDSWSWRIPSALQALPSVLQVFLIWFVPESPRWLISKGREEQALRTLAYYHADGNTEDPLVRYEFDEIKAAIEFDRTVAANVGWKSLFTTPGNLKRMRIIVALAFFSQWSSNGLASYFLNKVLTQIHITDPFDQLLINGILTIWNLFWAIGATFFVDSLGRRPLFLISSLGMFVFLIAETVCFGLASTKGSDAAGHGFLAFLFLFYAAYDIAFSPLIVSYTVEILPYALRAKGFTVFNFSISLSLIFNQYVNPIALAALGWKYYLVYVCWVGFEVVFLWFYLVETKNRTLEETAALFDGEDATKAIAEATHMSAAEEKIDEKRSDTASETH